MYQSTAWTARASQVLNHKLYINYNSLRKVVKLITWLSMSMLVLTHLVSLFLNTPTTLSNKKVAVATAIHSLQDKIMDVDMFKPG